MEQHDEDPDLAAQREFFRAQQANGDTRGAARVVRCAAASSSSRNDLAAQRGARSGSAGAAVVDRRDLEQASEPRTAVDVKDDQQADAVVELQTQSQSMPMRERRIQWERARNPELARLQEQGELQQRKQQVPVEQHHTPLDPGHFAVGGAADESRLPLAVGPALASTKTARRVQFQHEEAPRQSENSEIDRDAEFAQIDDDPNLDWFEKDEKKANILKARELRERSSCGGAATAKVAAPAANPNAGLPKQTSHFLADIVEREVEEPCLPDVAEALGRDEDVHGQHLDLRFGVNQASSASNTNTNLPCPPQPKLKKQSLFAQMKLRDLREQQGTSALDADALPPSVSNVVNECAPTSTFSPSSPGAAFSGRNAVSANPDAAAGGFGGAGEVHRDEAEDMERISDIADRQLSELSHTEILGYLSEIHSTFTPEQIQCLKRRGAGKKVDRGLGNNRNVKSNGMNNRGGSTTSSQKQKRSLFRAAVEENKLKHKKWGPRERRESMNQQSGGQGNQQSSSAQAQAQAQAQVAQASHSDSSDSSSDESLPDLQEESDRKNAALMKLHLSPYELRKLEWTEPVLLPEQTEADEDVPQSAQSRPVVQEEEQEDPVERAFRRGAAGGVATNKNGTTPNDPSDNPLVLDSLRFDLGGRLLRKDHRDLSSPTLYHHGQEPERAGYTFKELFYLAQSHHKAQKTLSLTTLQAILGKLWLTDGFGYCGGAGLFFDQLRGVLDLVLPHLADSDANVRWAALGVLEEMVCGGWDRTGKTEDLQQEEDDQEEDQEEHESPSRKKGENKCRTFYADPRYSTFLEVCEEVFELPAIPGPAVFHSVGENKNGGVFDSLLERQKYVSSHVVRQSKKGSLLESTSGELWSGDQQKPPKKKRQRNPPYLDAVKILVSLRDMALRVMAGKNVNDPRGKKSFNIPEQLLVLKIATGLMPHLMVDDTLVNAALGPIGRDGEPLEETGGGAEQDQAGNDEKPQSTSLQMLAHVASLSRVYGWVEQAGFGRGGTGGRAASSEDVEIEESAQLRAAVLRLVRVSSQVGGGLVSKFWLELYPDGEVQAAARAAVASGFLGVSRPGSKSSLLAGIEGLRLWTLWVRQNLGTTGEPMGRGGFGYVDEDLSVFLPQLCAQMISSSADPLFSPEEQLLRTAARGVFFRFCKELVVVLRVKSNTGEHLLREEHERRIFMLAPAEVVLEGVLLRDGKFHAGFFETMFMSTGISICGGSSSLEDEQRDHLDAAFFLTKLRNACSCCDEKEEEEQTEQTTANGKYFRLSNVIRGEDMPMLHFPLWSEEVARTVRKHVLAGKTGGWGPAGRGADGDLHGDHELTVAECSERWGRLLGSFSQEQGCGGRDPWQRFLSAAELLPAHYLPQLFLTQQGKVVGVGGAVADGSADEATDSDSEDRLKSSIKKFHHLALDEVRCRPGSGHEVAYEILARCDHASTARDLLHALRWQAEETITKETAGTTFESTQSSSGQTFQLVCLLMCLCRHFAAGTDENNPPERKDSKQRMTAPSLHDLLFQALRKLLLVSDVGENEGSSTSSSLSFYSEAYNFEVDLPQHEILPLLVDDLSALYLAYGDFLPAVGLVLGWVQLQLQDFELLVAQSPIAGVGQADAVRGKMEESGVLELLARRREAAGGGETMNDREPELQTLAPLARSI